MKIQNRSESKQRETNEDGPRQIKTQKETQEDLEREREIEER